jgi:hypothetical protein
MSETANEELEIQILVMDLDDPEAFATLCGDGTDPERRRAAIHAKNEGCRFWLSTAATNIGEFVGACYFKDVKALAKTMHDMIDKLPGAAVTRLDNLKPDLKQQLEDGMLSRKREKLN